MAVKKILFIHTAPIPEVVGTDAVYNETKLLLDNYGGCEITIFPFRRPNSFFPRFLYGLGKFRSLRKAQKDVTINHIFSPSLYYYPALRLLTKPIIFTVTAKIRKRDFERSKQRLKQLEKIIVSSRRDFQFLLDHGLKNVSLVLPGLDLSEFAPEKLNFQGKFILLMASAPWENSQFESKGVHKLFEILREKPSVHLILLWRGILRSELADKIRDFGVEDQVTVVDEYVDIKSILRKVHATALIVNNGNVVKAYPHSLIESLAVGKPVLISREIAMSDYVEEHGCGIVLEDFDHTGDALESMIDEYQILSKRTRELGGTDFLAERMLQDLNEIYEKIIQDLT